MNEEIHIHFENEFDRSGKDFVTSIVGGFVAIPLIFFAFVLLASCVA
jgi:hypothetical protein